MDVPVKVSERVHRYFTENSGEFTFEDFLICAQVNHWCSLIEGKLNSRVASHFVYSDNVRSWCPFKE